MRFPAVTPFLLCLVLAPATASADAVTEEGPTIPFSVPSTALDCSATSVDGPFPVMFAKATLNTSQLVTAPDATFVETEVVAPLLLTCDKVNALKEASIVSGIARERVSSRVEFRSGRCRETREERLIVEFDDFSFVHLVETTRRVPLSRCDE